MRKRGKVWNVCVYVGIWERRFGSKRINKVWVDVCVYAGDSSL